MTTSASNRYRAEMLPNGFVRVFDVLSLWASLYQRSADGRVTLRHGQISAWNHDAMAAAVAMFRAVQS